MVGRLLCAFGGADDGGAAVVDDDDGGAAAAVAAADCAAPSDVDATDESCGDCAADDADVVVPESDGVRRPVESYGLRLIGRLACGLEASGLSRLSPAWNLRPRCLQAHFGRRHSSLAAWACSSLLGYCIAVAVVEFYLATLTVRDCYL